MTTSTIAHWAGQAAPERATLIPEVRTPGGSGQASADQETTTTPIVVDIEATRKAETKAQADVFANAAFAGHAGHMRIVRQIGGTA